MGNGKCKSLLSSDVAQWVVISLGGGARIRSVSRLEGATSSTLYRIEAERGRRDVQVVLRLFTNASWLEEEPDLARHEAEALAKAGETGLPVPEVMACDERGDGCGVPAVLMTHLPGAVELNPGDFDGWLRRLAEALVAVHNVDADAFPWRYFSWADADEKEPPGWSRHPDLWARAIERVRQPAPDAPTCFLHRDYHPTNVLWQDGRISGVVDWVNACCGPACVDVSHCRGNLKAMYGVAAADRFLEIYRSVVGGGVDYPPYWDLDAAVNGLPYSGIYPPWIGFGLRNLDLFTLRARADEFLVGAMAWL